MFKTFVTALVALLLLGMLAACGGGDEATATPTAAPAQPATATATATTAPPATATATLPPEPTATVLPSPSPTAATPAPAPTRLIATPTPTPAPPTPTPQTESAGSVLLGYAALTVGDLGGDWVLDQVEVPEMSPDDTASICGQPTFPGRGEREAALQLEFASDSTPALLTQDLHIFPYSTAFDAMDYARDIAGACTEWTDDEGVLYQISVIDDPLLGDESFSIRLAFTTPEGASIEAVIIFLREDEFLMTLTYVTLAGSDFTALQGIAQTASAKVFGVSEAYYHPFYDPEYLAQSGARLLTTQDLPDEWNFVEYRIPTGYDRYGVCDASAFPDEFLALSEISALYEVHPVDGPFLSHNIVVFEDADTADDALFYVGEMSACGSWVDSTGVQYVVAGRTTLNQGDDSIAVLVQASDEEFGAVEIGFLFIRTGSIISVIMFAELGEIDQPAVEQIAQTALAKLGR